MKIIIIAIFVLISISNLYAGQRLNEIEVVASPIIEENKVTDYGNQISVVTGRGH